MAGVGGVTLADWATGQTCDWCQCVCELEEGELNILSCSYDNCPREGTIDNNSVYHKECVEKYLKGSMERGNHRTRKIGFKCPRGHTKLTEDPPCPGLISKSHPLAHKKKKKEPHVPAAPEPPRFGPEAKAARRALAAAEALKDNKDKESKTGKTKAVTKEKATVSREVPKFERPRLGGWGDDNRMGGGVRRRRLRIIRLLRKRAARADVG